MTQSEIDLDKAIIKHLSTFPTEDALELYLDSLVEPHKSVILGVIKRHMNLHKEPKVD